MTIAPVEVDHVESSETIENPSRPKCVEASYDGSEPVFRLLRLESGGSVLMNLGFSRLRGPLAFLNIFSNLSKAQMRLVFESARLLDVQPGQRVLDVACGRGQSSYVLQCLNPQSTVVGLDLLERHVQVARTLFGHMTRLSYTSGNAMSLDFPDASFDRILCLEAAFHFSDRTGFLAEAHRVLRPGGRLVVVDFAWNTDADRAHRNDPAVELVRKIWQWDDFFSIGEYIQHASAVGFAEARHHDWTPCVTAPIVRQLRLTSALGTTRWGRELLYFRNPLFRSFSRDDWTAIRLAADAHTEIHRHTSYVAFEFERERWPAHASGRQ